MKKSAEDARVARGISLLPLMTDFPNKFIYYPLANLFYYPVALTPLKPTHITIAHIIFAIVGSLFIIRGQGHDYIIAFVLFQLRAIFDCLDGTLARRKNLSSELGRIIDNLGDAIGFLCLMTAFSFYLAKNTAYPGWQITIIIFLTIFISGVMAQGTDFYRRKFSHALKDGRDIISEEISRKYHKLRNKEGGALLWYGYANDWFQILAFTPGSVRRLHAHIKSSHKPDDYIHDVITIREKADSPMLKLSMFITAMMSGDNAVFIIALGLLTPKPEYALFANMAYGLTMLMAGGIIMHYFFRKTGSIEK